ncbi:unnamed protein product [Blepharisma stoltei]|uniref:Uncharacterized protein n=1 Tax=Blepharisma stoltei TaxID=1481888 RepID=A0AAU9JNF3_9CILI|nr:unnamed protein product [Blepharisma stoltei]
MFENVYSISQNIDETITRRLGCLLAGYSIEQHFPELQQILPQPLIPDLNSEPKHNRLSNLQFDHQLLQEWKDMLSLLHLVNQDRIRLRELNFELLSIINKGNLPSTDFGAFLARSQLINYEIVKKSLEKEKEKNEELLKKFHKSIDQGTQTEEKTVSVPEINLPRIDVLDLSFKETSPTPLSTRVHSRMGSDVSMCSWQSTDSIDMSILNTSRSSTRTSTIVPTSKLPGAGGNINRGNKTRATCVKLGSRIGKPKN